eukprot:symbB.v1.2.015144.t1/scaffold1124.1/size136573/10
MSKRVESLNPTSGVADVSAHANFIRNTYEPNTSSTSSDVNGKEIPYLVTTYVPCLPSPQVQGQHFLHEIPRLWLVSRTHGLGGIRYQAVTRCAGDGVIFCAKVPVLPDRADADAWLKSYAATNDACALGRTCTEVSRKDLARCFHELGDLHWTYCHNRLVPYFNDVTKVLEEVPTEVLASSRALRRFVTGGVSGRPPPSALPIPTRFLGKLLPVLPPEEEVAKVARPKASQTTGDAWKSSAPSHPVAATGKLVDGKVEFTTPSGQVACGDCPRNGNVLNANREVCATAAFVSSAKSACVHPDRKDPYLCGDCPRNPKMALTFEQDEKAGTFAGCFAMEFRHDSFAGLRCCGIRVICKVPVHPSREEGSLSLR